MSAGENPKVRALGAAPRPAVVIEAWTGRDGWAAFHVFLDAHLFIGDDMERHHECQTYVAAIQAGAVLADCTGWPIQDRTTEFERKRSDEPGTP